MESDQRGIRTLEVSATVVLELHARCSCHMTHCYTISSMQYATVKGACCATRPFHSAVRQYCLPVDIAEPCPGGAIQSMKYKGTDHMGDAIHDCERVLMRYTAPSQRCMLVSPSGHREKLAWGSIRKYRIPRDGICITAWDISAPVE